MTHYQELRNAAMLITKLYNEGKNEVVIAYKIRTLFGFGDKIVKERIEQIEKMAEIESKNEPNKTNSTKNK